MSKKEMRYEAEQIETLEGLKAIRKMPGMYVGSVTTDGLHHILKEIISNGVDEFINGSGNEIKIVIKKDGSVVVADNGRGVPIGIHKSGCSTLQAVFGILNTGGKYNKDGKNGYNTSGGQHGVGAKATNALSDYLVASTIREGCKQTVTFKKGDFVSEKKEDTDMKSGTIVSFKPDATIFETVDYDQKRVSGLCEELSYLCVGLSFIIYDLRGEQSIKITHLSENGLLDYLEVLNKGKTVLTEPMLISSSKEDCGIDIALQYNAGYTDTVKLYTNMIPNLEGTHLTGFRSALTRAINTYARDNKLLKEKDSNLSGEDLKEGQTLIINLKMKEPIFEGQHKEKLSSTEGRTLAEQLTAREIRAWLEEHPAQAKTIVDKALSARKARDAAKRARETVRKNVTTSFSSVLPGKLADCQSKVVEECEIYIVEGDSAAGTAKNARCRKTQAILPLRGKVLNVMKTDFAKVISNAEIRAMAIAWGLQITENGITVDLDKIRYGKIIIMTDADIDGSHIRILLLTFIWKYAKELILNGYVYAAMSPLYKVTKGKDSVYLLDDKALEDYRKLNPGANLIIQRFKGLGELNADQLEETTMSKKNRVLKQITVKDIALIEKSINKLMGEQVQGRKEFIEENARRAKIEV